jgi:nucleoid-associated protein YgaU
VIISPPITEPGKTVTPQPGVMPSPAPTISPAAADDDPKPIQPTIVPVPMPPVGAPGVQTPPITVGPPIAHARPPLNVPQVDSFDEEMYRSKAGDTLKSISARFFGTEKYEQALLMFNRAHPMVAEGLQQVPPVLTPGTVVYIPPAKILEKRYGSVVQDLTPLRNDAKPSPLGTPTTMIAQPKIQLQTQPQPQPQSVWRKYKVRGAGEYMLDIAHRTLGNRDRWREILKLNQHFQPNVPVPANEVLNLPPDAKIDGDHAP